jgi:hypothetical protein
MTTTIQPGDRVKWMRPRFDGAIGRHLTGTVREVKRDADYEYAIVATDPDGRLTMPALSMLQVVVEEQQP